MSRDLHIHIHENPSVYSASGRPPRRRRPSLSDPSGGTFLADPDDPSGGTFLADPDDPSGGTFLADPDDPSGGTFLADPDDPSGGTFLADPDDPSGGTFLADPDDPSGGTFLADPDDPSRIRYGARPGLYVSATSPKTRNARRCGTCEGRCCCSTEGATTTQAAPRANVAGRELSGFLIVRLRPGYLSAKANDLVQLACELQQEALAQALQIEPGPEAAGDQDRQRWTYRALLERYAAGKGTPDDFLYSRPLIELRAWPGRDSRSPFLSRARVCAAIATLEERASSTPWAPLHSLNSYWRVDLRHHPAQAAAVMVKLRAVAAVDLVYREMAPQDAQVPPALTQDQGYLQEGPIGVGANWAWEHLDSPKPLNKPFSQTPPSLVICDLEQGWNLDHTDLAQVVSPLLVYGANRRDEGFSGDHGTAVLGQMAGSGNEGGGVRGAASGVAGFVLASHYRSRTEIESGTETHRFAGTSGHVAAAIVAAMVDLTSPPKSYVVPPPRDPTRGTPLQPGDVLLLEVQRGLMPTEFDAADFDAIRLATSLGIVVVEAAGNGGFNLDDYRDPNTGQSWRRGDGHFRDSGAILVGASLSALPHDRASFSNFGSRLDCFAWGEMVTSSGFGDLAGASTQDQYTNRFRGTSSAAPIIAGAAALLQRIISSPAQSSPLQPRAMRAILANPANGTRQGRAVPGFIGVMPNLRTICRRFLQAVPDVYLRRSVDDDGSVGSRGAMASSPDILLSEPPFSDFAKSSTANFPAPGLTLRAWGNPPNFVSLADPALIDPAFPGALKSVEAKLFVRLRNRGRGVAKNTRVQVFASPAATLISPDRWIAVGEAMPPNSVDGIPDGDLPTVWEVPAWGKPLAGELAELVPEQMTAETKSPWLTDRRPPVSLLAVERPSRSTTPFRIDRSLGLPPGPPYFNWQEFRRFLRSRHVAWRNIHAMPVPQAGPVVLPFLIAGAPDLARPFDFELISRLPSQISVELIVPSAFTAKLRQRQPWLNQPLPLLPPRPRIAFKGIQLAAEALIPAQLVLTGAQPQAGHSIAFRQVWRGEEVGRVTFLFTDGGTE